MFASTCLYGIQTGGCFCVCFFPGLVMLIIFFINVFFTNSAFSSDIHSGYAENQLSPLCLTSVSGDRVKYSMLIRCMSV